MLTLRFIKDVKGPDITNEVLCSEPNFTSYCIMKLESSLLMTLCHRSIFFLMSIALRVAFIVYYIRVSTAK
jgi:hypothetical protein